MLGQHVVIAADSQPDGPVFPVIDPGIGNREEVQVNHVVQCSYGALRYIGYLLLICKFQSSKREAGKVAHHEFARLCNRHHHRLPIYLFNLLLHLLDGAHILRDLRTQVAAVDDSLVAVGISAVYRIPVERKRRPRLHRAFDDQSYNILDRNDPFLYPGIPDAVLIPFFPVFSKIIFQRIAFHRQYLMRTHQIPVSFDVIPCFLPEVVRIADCREYVVSLHPVVPVIRP